MKADHVCTCGQRHLQPQSIVRVGSGILDSMGAIIQELSLGGSCVLVCDGNTYEVAGSKVFEQLQAVGKDVQVLKFQRSENLVPNEQALGELFQALVSKPDFLIAVGSGTISDLTRYAAFIAGIPFVLVATAPSMDGYSSTVSSLVQHGTKQTFLGKEAFAILGDTRVLSEAPLHMIQSGAGDLLGKMISRADWKLSHLLTGEAHCASIQERVNQAIDLTVEQMNTLAVTSEEFAETLMQGLILSGEAITLFGGSRPASGAEHQLAHYWKKLALKEERTVGLHGQKVGCATRIILKVYHKVAERVQREGSTQLQRSFDQVMAELPSVEWYDALLEKAGMSFTLDGLGIPKEWVEDGLLNAMYLRDRHSILRLADEYGWLEDITRQIMLEEID